MSPFIHEAIGFAGFGTNVAGNMLLTSKNVHGWWIRIVSNALWLVYAGLASSFAVTANAIVFSGINVYGWWRWRRENRRGEAGTEGTKR